MRRFIMAALLGLGLASAVGFGVVMGDELRGARGKLRGGEEVEYREHYVKGEFVTVAVDGNGDGDLDLFVACEEHGVEVGRDDDATDICLVEFEAPETGYYTIRVVNVGSGTDVFTIGTKVE